MTAQEKAQAWKKLIEYLNLIQDPILRKSFYCEYQARAQKEWGYCPGKIIESDKPELNEWEEEFLEDIKISEECGMNTRKEKYLEEIRRANIQMYEFVCSGHSYSEIPDSIKSKNLHDLYVKCLCEVVEQTCKEADLLIKA